MASKKVEKNPSGTLFFQASKEHIFYRKERKEESAHLDHSKDIEINEGKTQFKKIVLCES